MRLSESGEKRDLLFQIPAQVVYGIIESFRQRGLERIGSIDVCAEISIAIDEKDAKRISRTANGCSCRRVEP